MSASFRDTALAIEYRLHTGLRRHRAPLNVAGGYAAGLGVPAIHEVGRDGIVEAVRGAFFATSFQSGLSLLAILVGVFYGAVGPWLHHRAAHRTLDRAIFAAFRQYVDPLFLDGPGGMEGLGWGRGQTILPCPRPEAGWASQEVQFRINRAQYDFRQLDSAGLPSLAGRKIADEYDAYRTEEFPRKFAYDAERWAVRLRPTSFSDSIAIRLDVVRTSWSQCQFFWNNVVSPTTLPDLYGAAQSSAVLPYPNSLCLHLVVFSSEGLLLLTRAHGAKTDDYPLSWACSVGEQVSSDDLDNLDDDCAQKWVSRALWEELAIVKTEANEGRFLALTYEGNNSNMAMVCVVQLRLSADDVVARLATTNRLDNEFSEVEFVPIDIIPQELAKPSREYHPSTGLRMMYAFLHVRGQHALRRELARELGIRL